jgi:hypothetical protein
MLWILPRELQEMAANEGARMEKANASKQLKVLAPARQLGENQVVKPVLGLDSQSRVL